MGHCQREGSGFAVAHAVEQDGHSPGSGLIIGNLAVGKAAHEKVYFGFGEFLLIAFFDDDVNCAHG